MSTITPDVVILVGAGLEVVGVFMMSSAYLSATRVRQRLWILFGALFRSDAAKGAIDVSGLNKANPVLLLQGLAFIGVGFICQAGAAIWKIFVQG